MLTMYENGKYIDTHSKDGNSSDYITRNHFRRTLQCIGNIRAHKYYYFNRRTHESKSFSENSNRSITILKKYYWCNCYVKKKI